MFSRLDKFDGPIFGGMGIYTGSYIRDVNWFTYLGSVYSGWGEERAYIRGGGVLTGFYT